MQDQRNERAGRRERVERNIYRRTDSAGHVRFEIGYRDSDGRQRWQAVEGGIKAARTALADVKARMGKGERVAPARNLTFAVAAERWYKAQVTTLRPATQASYSTALRIHLLPRWGRRRLDSLDVDDVARLIEDMRRNGRKAWTIRGQLTVAGRVFDFAHRRLGWAGQNPVRMLDRSERPRSDQRERRVLDRDELARLIACADEAHRPIFAFAAGTGARLGETLGLKWRSLDLDGGIATVTHQLDRRGQHVELKTQRSRRTVELPATLASMLRAHKLRSARTGPDDHVFTTSTGRPRDHRNVAGHALGRAVRLAGLDAQEGQSAPTFHSLRHGFASAWIASGGDLVELSAHLGHRDPAITASVYSHEFEKAARSDARRARLDSIFGSTIAALADDPPRDQGALPASQVVALRAGGSGHRPG